MNVLAFDTATLTGAAFGATGTKPRTWTVSLGKAGWPDRFAKTLRMVNHYVRTLKPDLIAVEAFVGGPKANSNLVGLVACVQGEAHRLKVPCVSYYPATVRAHFLRGIRTGDPIKSQVYAKCHALGWDVKDTDAADAAALWDYTCSVHDRAHHTTSVGGLFA